MEEDSLAPFADFLADDRAAVQEPGRFQELNDYGRLYEYKDGFADFSVWDGASESKQKTRTALQSTQSFPIQTQDAEVISGVTFELRELSADDSAEVVFPGESCAFCLEALAVSRCAHCQSAYYCSKEHQAAHSAIHETSCGNFATPDESSNSHPRTGFSEPGDLAPDDSGLRSEMLELLSIFQVVYENKPGASNIRSLLKRCISMCERIMERFGRLPQVLTMHEQATSLLQMFQNGETESFPFTASPNFSTDNRGMSAVRDHLKADVKEALDRVDRDAEDSDLLKSSDVGEVVNGVYRHKGIWYCKTHTVREKCEQCGVDYSLLNQVHRYWAEEADQVDDTVRKEQQRLEVLELQRIGADSAGDEPAQSTHVHTQHDDVGEEDFHSIAKDLKEELDRAREKDEAEFQKAFAAFQIA